MKAFDQLKNGSFLREEMKERGKRRARNKKRGKERNNNINYAISIKVDVEHGNVGQGAKKEEKKSYFSLFHFFCTMTFEDLSHVPL